MKSTIGLSMILSVMLCVSCNKNEPDVLQEVVKINILPSVEINQDEYTPLRSASVKDSLIYAIQIYEEGVPCYYGLFNDVSKMEIALTTNKNYVLKIAAYQNGSGSGLKNTENNGLITYYLPDTVSLLNKFVEGNKLSGISSVRNVQLTDNKYSQYPEIDVFYQEKEVSITKGMSNIEIPLKRTGFGLGISVDGLSTGKIEVYFAGDTIHLTPSIKSYFTIRSFIGGTKGLDDVAKVDTYFVNTNIAVKWIGNNGTVVTASKTIKIKRNYQLPLYINFNTTDAGITLDSWQNDIADSIIKNNIPTLGLIAWFPFNGNANDESGNSNNGIIIGNVKLTSDRKSKVESAYEFPGIAFNYIQIPDNPTLSLNIFTINAWIYTSTDYGSGFIVSKNRDVVNGHYSLHVDYVRAMVSYSGSNGTVIVNSPAIGEWHMITGIVVGNKATFYIDGLLKNENVISANFTCSGSAPLAIGMQFYSGIPSSYTYPFKGKIDDIGIWNRALTQEEITKLHNP